MACFYSKGLVGLEKGQGRMNWDTNLVEKKKSIFLISANQGI